MIEKLLKLKEKNPKIIVGLMSGTSADGIDVAVVKVYNSGTKTKVETLGWKTFAFDEGLKKMILRNSQPETSKVDEICRLNFLLAQIYVDSIFKTLDELGIKPSEVDLIGSHGQTIQHLPNEVEIFGYKVKATLQIGDPGVIAKLSGIPTVGNFRVGDVALGGEGAPLVPYFDYLVFRSNKLNRLVLNIGGIANFTILKKNCDVEDVFAFDTGPGNMVVDSLMKLFFDREFDENGEIAQKGKVSDDLLQKMAQHPFINKKPPKSTGREEFGSNFVNQILKWSEELSLSPEDIIATATEFTVYAIYKNYENFVKPNVEVDEIIVSGGGARNKFMMWALERYFNVPVKFTDEFGISSDAKEAICFAVLANETISGNPSNIKSVTGARERTVLGGIYF
ncbi:anhydro-N-acetylmuramic acid kinase [Candidatus Chrysopegis kryptomonas]|uniref:Anhydro-N-acetylmuramic acid kinase n=1 Tax=Candidatus Chryseopegocella kryptomonas TaxID=1633643 RepID=A0A0P1MR97_9BACT|nr:anhydro-N-acetylmuramic acid kinase [Candidatus Chrysopegis kryptomonas]CUS98039.1 anhydro-N-acetylmuramic acid kinase [Candidatus Chrysopegis kryptomonas]